MSYQLHREDDYQSLNEERKRKILRELHDEMDKLKVKYMLDEKKDNKKLSQIKSLDSLESSIRIRRYSEDDDKVTIEEKSVKNHLEQPAEISDGNRNLSDQHHKLDEISHPLNASQLQKSQVESIKGEFTPRESYEMFDKAKQNLLKIKNELDDLDQYDYKNRIFKNKENFNFSNNPNNYDNCENEILEEQHRVEEENTNHLINSNKNEYDIDVDEYIEEEEKPKNYEDEISMSLSKSLREETGPIENNYHFNAPYVISLNRQNNYQKNKKQLNLEQPNNHMFLSERKNYSRSNSKEEKASTSPYFKK